MDANRVPLVVYNKSGERIVIGEAVVNIYGETLHAEGTITNNEFATFLIDVKDLSIRSLGFDQKKEV